MVGQANRIVPATVLLLSLTATGCFDYTLPADPDGTTDVPVETDTADLDVDADADGDPGDADGDGDPVEVDCNGFESDQDRALFVAPDGNDSSPGTMGQPMRSIQVAIDAAASNAGKDAVYVSAGEYEESLVLRDGVSVYGGFDRGAGWTHNASNTVTINAPGTVGVRADDISTSITLGWLSIVSANAAGPGEASFGIVASSSTLVIHCCSITSGAGGAGAGGTDGADGEGFAGHPEMEGGSGLNGCEYGCHCPVGCGECGDCDQPVPGGGGTSPCGNNGGAGGAPGRYESGGMPGEPGSGGALGGEGGPSTCAAIPGGEGGAGLSPAFEPPWNGSAGNGTGSIIVGEWVPSPGGDGTQGPDGHGGGGGGGGGGDCHESCLEGLCESYGGSGGGGGGGGCGGFPGTAGGGGGASMAILLVDSEATVYGCRIATLGGGDGGAGGSGGNGGGGGPGGDGGFAEALDQGGPGGAGGSGGNGAHGGAGGGGGGGPSIGIGRTGASILDEIGNTFVLAAGGSGGSSSGNAGLSGVTENIHSF